MTLYEYYQLPRRQQIDLLYEQGIYLSKRRKADIDILLYQFDSFYIEVYYRKYRSVIEKLKCFHSIELLSPYLEMIDIDELVKYAE